MGLDILIENKNEKPRRTCHLSRQFCREMMSQAENEDSIINQLIKKYQIKTKVIDEMNVWDLEKNFHSSSEKISKKELEDRYGIAWQKSQDVLEEFVKLRRCFETDEKISDQLKNADKYQKVYYRKTVDPIIMEGIQKTFMFDLDSIISYLNEMSKHESVKFHYF